MGLLVHFTFSFLFPKPSITTYFNLYSQVMSLDIGFWSYSLCLLRFWSPSSVHLTVWQHFRKCGVPKCVQSQCQPPRAKQGRIITLHMLPTTLLSALHSKSFVYFCNGIILWQFHSCTIRAITSIYPLFYNWFCNFPFPREFDFEFDFIRFPLVLGLLC